MIRSSLLVVAIIFCGCSIQKSHDQKLLLRLEQIKELKYFDNSVVISIDSVEYHDLRFPYWKPKDVYYMNDVTRFKYCSYEALIDSLVGQRPDISPHVWKLIYGPHPFLYLRDTAEVNDLKSLLTDKHPYVRTYAFGALSFRNEPNLFSKIIDNLKDTIRMEVLTGDVMVDTYPAELMIQYEYRHLRVEDREKLKSIVSANHPYLLNCLESFERATLE